MINRRSLLLLLPLVIFVGIFFWFLNLGQLGHDYFYFFPKLLAGKWHFLRQGLMPFTYTPHFCGGIPQYGNPQSLYYSLLQFLTLFLDLWLSAQIVIAMGLIIGYVGWYRLARDIILLSVHWSHVLALIVIAHGFYFMHMIPGHIVFHTMPLLGWLLWIIFDRHQDSRKSLVTRAVSFALITAAIMYSGGYMVGIMGIIAFFVFLPIELILHRNTLRTRGRTLLMRGMSCGIAALFISLSKLVAIFSFMRFFQRGMPLEQFPNDVFTIGYIFKAFWALPQSESLFQPYGIPDWGAVHEYSMGVSPVVLLGLLSGVLLLIRHRNLLMTQWKVPLMFTMYGIGLLTFFIQLTRGHGWIVTIMKSLPVLQSLHMFMRYLYAFSFILIGVSVWALQKYLRTSRWASYELPVTLGMSAITIVAFVLAYLPLLQGNMVARTLPYDVILGAFDDHPGFLMQDVQEAYDMRGKGHSGFIPLLFGGSEIYCHEPVFLGDSNLPDVIVAAPVNQQREDGTFNIRNPACLIYPDENNCKIGDRIAVDDLKNFERFRRGLPVTWKISTTQHISNWISLLTLLFCALSFVPWRRITNGVRSKITEL